MANDTPLGPCAKQPGLRWKWELRAVGRQHLDMSLIPVLTLANHFSSTVR